MEKLITSHCAAMGEVDRRHRVKLVVDEWGAWHRAGTEVASTHLFGQTSTMRDALVAGLTLDIFNRHADKVAMANVAQLINNLHSLFLAHEDKFVATPNFHVFEMYAAHHHGQSLRTVFETPAIEPPGGKGSDLPGLAGSASLHEKRLVLTVVNPHATDPRAAEIRVRGAGIKSATGVVLAAADIHAHNTFAQPAAVTPRPVTGEVRGPTLLHSFAPASVTRLELALE
jgi:alpha-N-arabinofuranosidase